MKIKKLISVLLALLLLAALFAPAAFAAGTVSGTLEAEGFTWSVENGVLTVAYSGETPAPMPDMPYDQDAGMYVQPWSEYIKAVRRIVVSGNVTAVGDGAFYNAWDCTEAVLPEGLERIGECAFQFATSLERIQLPSTLKEIAYSGFYASGITEIALPEGLTTLGRMAFGYCFSLAVAELPSTITSYARNVFLLCPRLYAVVNRSTGIAAFDQSENMVLAFDTVSHNERYVKYLDLELEVWQDFGYDENHEELVKRYNAFYGTDFSDIDALTNSFYAYYLPEALAGDYVTFYCLTGSAEQAFCEEHGLTYVLTDTGEPYCVHHITLNTLIEPTCTQNGYRGGAACLDCEKIFEAPEILPPKGHSPEVLPGFEPTCTACGATDGEVCSECGEILIARQAIPPLPHGDADGDGRCDGCGEPMETANEQKPGLFEEIRRVFATFIDRLLALFRKMFG